MYSEYFPGSSVIQRICMEDELSFPREEGKGSQCVLCERGRRLKNEKLFAPAIAAYGRNGASGMARRMPCVQHTSCVREVKGCR